MRLALFAPILVIFSCQQQQTDHTENLTDHQIDSLASELTFNFGAPIELKNADLVIIPIQNNVPDWKDSKSVKSYRASYMSVDWNLLFFDRSADSTYLLTEDKMYLTRLETPESNKNLKDHLIFEAISIDSNKDSKLNYSDTRQLYVSNLDGSNLHQVTADNENLEQYRFSRRTNELYIKTRIDSNNDDHIDDNDSEQWYTYHLDSNSKPVEIIDSTTQSKIGKLFIKNWVK